MPHSIETLTKEAVRMLVEENKFSGQEQTVTQFWHVDCYLQLVPNYLDKPISEINIRIIAPLAAALAAKIPFDTKSTVKLHQAPREYKSSVQECNGVWLRGTLTEVLLSGCPNTKTDTQIKPAWVQLLDFAVLVEPNQ